MFVVVVDETKVASAVLVENTMPASLTGLPFALTARTTSGADVPPADTD